MHRIFGKAKPKEPTPTLDDASASVEKRGTEVDGKIKTLDDELLRFKQQLSKMKPGAAKNGVQQRALRVLKQKKMYEKQRDTLYNQSFNVDQTRFAIANVKDTVTTVAAMKGASQQLKVSMKEVNLDEIEDLHDDMSEMLEDADEINEIMGRAYGVPDELNEEDLMSELGALEDELANEESEQLPCTITSHRHIQQQFSYLVNAASASHSAAISTPAVSSASSSSSKPKEQVAVDEFGLPEAPQRSLDINA